MNTFKNAAVIAILATGAVLANDEARYVGAAKCAKMCHSSEKKGNQLGAWKNEKHSKAYATLGTEKAKQMAKAAGITGDPQKSGECLKCHSTAYGVKAELRDSTFSIADGVSCESCHGAGSKYMKMTIMKDKAKSIENGLVTPSEKVCAKCHNDSAPGHNMKFDYKTQVKDISHPNPLSAEK